MSSFKIRFASVFSLAALGLTSLLVSLGSIRQVNQWETALKFTLGKLTGRVSPGLTFVLPGVQRLVRIDTRVRNRDLPQQAVITADNVTAWIDAPISVMPLARNALNEALRPARPEPL